MDAGIIKNLKLHYRALLVEKRLNAYEDSIDFKVDLLRALRILKVAWAKISNETIVNCFAHCFNDTTEIQVVDVVNSVADISDRWNRVYTNLGEITEDYTNVDDELAICEGPDSFIGEAPESTELGDNIPDSDEDDIFDPDPQPKPTLVNCFEALVTLRSYFHYEENDCEQEMEKIEACLRKNIERRKQTSITDFFNR